MANEIMLIDRQGNAVTERAIAEMMQSGELVSVFAREQVTGIGHLRF